MRGRQGFQKLDFLGSNPRPATHKPITGDPEHVILLNSEPVME